MKLVILSTVAGRTVPGEPVACPDVKRPLRLGGDASPYLSMVHPNVSRFMARQ